MSMSYNKNFKNWNVLKQFQIVTSDDLGFEVKSKEEIRKQTARLKRKMKKEVDNIICFSLYQKIQIYMSDISYKILKNFDNDLYILELYEGYGDFLQFSFNDCTIKELNKFVETVDESEFVSFRNNDLFER